MTDAEQTLRVVLRMIAKEQGYNDCETVIQEFSTGGANFTSFLYRITLSSSGKDDLKMFAKVACVSDAIRAQMPFKIYDTETYFYTELLKRYQELEERHNVPMQHSLATVKYYGSSQEYQKEVLVLEDLTPQGFETHDRLKSYDWEYASKSIVELAKLHALSIALLKEHPDEIDKLTEKFKMNTSKEQMQQMMDGIIKTNLVAVDEENKAKLLKFLDSLQNLDADHYFKSLRLPVIAHGDFRPSNLMHRASENSEMKVFALDYQLLRISNPICDLMFFIFSGSDEKFREKYYHQLLDHYYKELCSALKRLGIDPEGIYSKEDFDYEVKEIQPYGLLVAIMMIPMLTVEAENAPNTSEMTGIEDFIIKPNELAKTRLNGIINDFVKLGVL